MAVALGNPSKTFTLLLSFPQEVNSTTSLSGGVAGLMHNGCPHPKFTVWKGSRIHVVTSKVATSAGRVRVASKKSTADRMYWSVITAMASCTSLTAYEIGFSESSPAVAIAHVSTMPFPMKYLGRGGENLGRPSTANSNLLIWAGGMSSASVRARHVAAVNASNVDTLLTVPSSRIRAFRFSSSRGVKVMELKMSLSPIRSSLLADRSSISSNSWCGNSIRGGCRAWRTVRSMCGQFVMSRPRASSPHARTNSLAERPSIMQWLLFTPITKPPHLNVVTCEFSDYQIPESVS